MENKLIAEFMEYPSNGFGKYICPVKDIPVEANELPYHTDWNWLMPVVDMINNIERYEVCIGNCHCHITDIENNNYKIKALTLSLQGKTTFKAIYQAVIEFIKWYNKYGK